MFQDKHLFGRSLICRRMSHELWESAMRVLGTKNTCDTPPLRYSNDLAFLAPSNCILAWSPPTLLWTDLCNQEGFAEMMECDFQGWALKPWWLPSFSLGSLSLRDPDNMWWGHSSKPMERPMQQKTEASCQLSASTCQEHEQSVHQPRSNLQMATALADSLAAVAWEPLPQHHPVSQAGHTVWGTRCLLLVSAAKFWINCYTVIDDFIMEVPVSLSLPSPTVMWLVANQSVSLTFSL